MRPELSGESSPKGRGELSGYSGDKSIPQSSERPSVDRDPANLPREKRPLGDREFFHWEEGPLTDREFLERWERISGGRGRANVQRGERFSDDREFLQHWARLSGDREFLRRWERLLGGRDPASVQRPNRSVAPPGPPTGISDHSSETALPDRKIKIRDEITGAIAEYTANELDNRILDSMWNLFKTSDGNGFIGTAQIIASLDRDVHIVGLRDPSGALLSFADVPDASFWSSIIQDAPIDAIDKPLGSIQRLLEVGGIVIGIMGGHPAMAYACFKALLHDEVHRMSAAAIDYLLAGDRSGSPRGNESPAGQDNAAHAAVLDPHANFKANTAMVAPAKTSRQRAEQQRAEQERADRQRAEQERADRQRAEQERADRQRAEAQRAERQSAARAGQQETVKAPWEIHSVAADVTVPSKDSIGRASYKVSEGLEASTSASLPMSNAQPSGSPAVQNNPSYAQTLGDKNSMLSEAIRLRIYYDSSYPVIPGNRVTPPTRLTRLVVLRDLISILPGKGIEDSILINSEAQLWNVTDRCGFVWVPLSMATLQRDLCRTFLGHSLGIADRSYTIENIPTCSGEQYLNPGMGCIEIIGITNKGMPEDSKVACVGFKAPVNDGFCRVVICAVEKLVAADQL